MEKAKKLLNKADSAQRGALLEQLKPLLEKTTRQKRLLVYLDNGRGLESHSSLTQKFGWPLL